MVKPELGSFHKTTGGLRKWFGVGKNGGSRFGENPKKPKLDPNVEIDNAWFPRGLEPTKKGLRKTHPSELGGSQP